jgi:hypothetical protein
MVKKVIRLTESDLVKLVNKVINEQDSESFDDYVYEIEQIYQEFFFSHHDDMTEEDLDYAHDAIAQVLDHAENNKNISDDEFEELYDIADEMHMELNHKFEFRSGLDEGTKDKKSKSIKSKRSGVKTQKLINQNYEVIKKIVKEQLEIDDIEDEKDEIHPSLARQLRHFDPDEFILIGKIKVIPNPPSKTPDFILRNRNKTEDGTKILGLGFGYEDNVVKLTGVTKNGKPPSFQNPLKLIKRPQVLSR